MENSVNLYAEVTALQRLVAYDVARRWPIELVDRWHAAEGARADDDTQASEALKADLHLALDRLASDVKRMAARMRRPS